MHYQRVGRTCSSGQRVRAAPADVMAEAPHAYETSADYYVYIYGHYTVYVRVLMTNTVLSPIGVLYEYYDTRYYSSQYLVIREPADSVSCDCQSTAEYAQSARPVD